MTPTPKALAKAREIVSEHDDVLSDFSDLRHTLIAEFALALDAFADETAQAERKELRQTIHYVFTGDLNRLMPLKASWGRPECHADLRDLLDEKTQ